MASYNAKELGTIFQKMIKFDGLKEGVKVLVRLKETLQNKNIKFHKSNNGSTKLAHTHPAGINQVKRHYYIQKDKEGAKLPVILNVINDGTVRIEFLESTKPDFILYANASEQDINACAQEIIRQHNDAAQKYSKTQDLNHHKTQPLYDILNGTSDEYTKHPQLAEELVHLRNLLTSIQEQTDVTFGALKVAHFDNSFDNLQSFVSVHIPVNSTQKQTDNAVTTLSILLSGSTIDIVLDGQKTYKSSIKAEEFQNAFLEILASRTIENCVDQAVKPWPDPYEIK